MMRCDRCNQLTALGLTRVVHRHYDLESEELCGECLMESIGERPRRPLADDVPEEVTAARAASLEEKLDW